MHADGDAPLDPFAPPEVQATQRSTARDPARERTVWRVAGWLLFFGAFGLFWTLTSVVGALAERRFEQLVVPALFFLASVAQVAAGLGLRAQAPWSRVLALVAQIPVLPLFPLGTWVAVRSLIALLGAPGQVVLARNYPRVPAGDRGRPSAWVPLAAPLVVVGLLYGIFRLALPR